MKGRPKRVKSAKRIVLLGPVARGRSALEFIRKELKALGFNRAQDFLIAVDGGLDVSRRLGLVPDLAIGDWDSMPHTPALLKLRDHLPHVTLPRDKDHSDLWFAMKEAERLQARQIHCYGVSAGRPDHHQAMLLDLGSYAAKLDFLGASGPEARYYFLSSRSCRRLDLRLRVGQVVSVFGEASGVRYKGLKFEPQGGILESGSQGLSNQVVGKRLIEHKLCRIELKEGHLLVVIPKSGPNGLQSPDGTEEKRDGPVAR